MYNTNEFPSLNRHFNLGKAIFMDGPAGTQVPVSVTSAITAYYENSNANTHGYFTTARETDEVIQQCRMAAANLFGAEGPHNISFGQNMTTLNYSLARAIGRHLQHGDEILITQLDHEANRGPWLSLRNDGIIVREVKLLANGTLDYEDMRAKINEKTRLLAMGWASNITGTINDVRRARELTHTYGAWLLLDAVHYAPHFSMDVQEVDCDFCLCSAYKFYGPHVGLLYAKTGLLDRLPTDRLRTSDQMAPYSIETGTLNHAALAGVEAAIRYIGGYGKGDTLREQIVDSFIKLSQHENEIAHHLYKGLQNIKDISIIGPGFESGQERAPTISFTARNATPDQVCSFLSQRDIFAWNGHFYALRAVEVLGLNSRGGVTRMGASGYTKPSDIDGVLEAVDIFINKFR